MLFSLIFIMVGCQLSDEKIRKNQTIEAERIISENSEYREVNDVCNKIPIPETSTLIGKARLFNSVGISNYYYSEENPNNLWKHYENFFLQNDWKISENKSVNQTMLIKKDIYEINIQFGGIGRGISYSINCSKVAVNSSNPQ